MDAVTVRLTKLTPAAAELAVTGPDADIHGRLTGPRCRYATTVEIAYPIKPVGPGVGKVIIPEPNLWSPEAPFLYVGTVGAVPVWVGLRHVEFRGGAVVWNGKPLELRAETFDVVDEDVLLRWRVAGGNLAVVPADADDAVWAAADGVGMLVHAPGRGDNGTHPSMLTRLPNESR